MGRGIAVEIDAFYRTSDGHCSISRAPADLIHLGERLRAKVQVNLGRYPVKSWPIVAIGKNRRRS